MGPGVGTSFGKVRILIMTVTSQSRGHEIYYDKGHWRWQDDSKPVNDKRCCKKCNKPPTDEGHDACLGHIEGVKSACCGHGVEEGYQIKNGE